MRIADPKGFASGLMFVAIGAVAGAIAMNYRLGTTAAMGPGYFPLLISGLLAVLGLGVMLQSLGHAQGPAIPRTHFRSLLTVLLSFVLFGLALNYLGLLLTVAAMVVLAGVGEKGFKWRTVLLTAAALAVLSLVLFAYILGLPLKIWPSLSSGI